VTRKVHIVPHTHWDREWYAPFQSFRLQLVDLLDDLLPSLDADPSFVHFLLDGQMAVVDDYLAVRPDAEATLRRLAASGRLETGPWYILMDEFLVSGETIVRNLQMGLDRAAAFGGAMEVGYLPDMFGHIAQMPQLLRQFGFEHAVVWRGVPASVDKDAFWWSAPDGSRVRAEYLVQGYGNGAYLPDDAKGLVGAIEDFACDWKDVLTGPILWMNGTDHLVPQLRLGRLVTEANTLQDDYDIAVTSLAEHLGQASVEDLPSWRGELRSGAHANVLMGVTSNRVDVRRAAARAERALERAEALAALFQPVDRWPSALLHEGWLHVVRNAAHDSVCACSIDEVCEAVLSRYAEAATIGEGLAQRALDALGSSVPGDGPVIVNPTARPRAGVVEVIVPGSGPRPGAQILNERRAERVVAELDLATMAGVVVRELKHNRRIEAIALESVETGEELWRAEREQDGSMLTSGTRADLDELVASGSGSVRLRVRTKPTQKLLVRVAGMPGYSWRSWKPVPLDVDAAGADERSLWNGLVRVDVAGDGTWSIDGREGFGRIVRGGDVGDTYNWCPPDDDLVVDAPERVDVAVEESGPVRAQLRITSSYRWPSRQGGPRVDVDVATRLELQAGERLLRVSTEWHNPCRDQRVRVWFPLASPADRSRAECSFAIVERGLRAEGGPNEIGLPTFPSKRFVQSGGLTVVHDGVMEYELVDVRDGLAHALALTLVRCTAMLGQGPMATRPLPAAPMIPVEGAQMLKRVRTDYGICIGDADPYALVDELLAPLLVTKTGGGQRTADGQALDVDGAVVSSLRRVAGRLEVRVFNPSDDITTVVIDGRSGWLVDLRGRALEPFTGSFELGPWRIATAVLD
jgi:alpha-mannosidase